MWESVPKRTISISSPHCTHAPFRRHRSGHHDRNGCNNYVILVSHIIVEHLSAFSTFKHYVPQHIHVLHKYAHMRSVDLLMYVHVHACVSFTTDLHVHVTEVKPNQTSNLHCIYTLQREKARKVCSTQSVIS